jgi:hypothetical protein
LLDLHEAIQDAFDFDDDHLYSFFMPIHLKLEAPLKHPNKAGEFPMRTLSLTGLKAVPEKKYRFGFSDSYTDLLK